GPVSVWLLAWRWTRALWPSAFAAAFYGLLSPCSWLMPSIAGDLAGYWFNQRLSVLTRYGEGPHLASLALLPLALLAVDCALEKFSWRRAALAALACAAVPLSNIIGGFALAFGVLAIVAARGVRSVLPVLAIGGWAYLLALRWLTPTNLSDIARNAQFVGGVHPIDLSHYLQLAALAVVTVVSVVLIQKRSTVASAVGFLIPMAAIPLSWEFLEIYFVPQPHRYHLEMDLGIALLVAAGMARLPRSWVWSSAGIGALSLFCIFAGRGLDKYIEPFKYKESWERRITRAMANHDPEARVYFQGTPRFFAGVEFDQMQFGGGFSNGVRLPVFFLADYGITVNRGIGPLTVAWLKALGVDYVAVGDEKTEDPFKPWQDPHQFDGLLTEVWREGGDAIFEVRRANESLAHTIPESALMLKAPVSYLEKDGLLRYVDALEGPLSNGGVLRWITPSRAELDLHIRAGDAISVQVAHDARWVASVKGSQWPIHKDGFGWMWIEPKGTGEVTLTLEFHNPKLLFLIWGTAWLILLGALSNFGTKEKL
ncbi:MAG: hypothetical protein NTW74_16110, partial [Acidobacteria bacterium]|nr:hypothetical protein [Acidobacteriota bacterium]